MKEVQKETEKEEILDELAAQDTLNQAQKQKYNDYVKMNPAYLMPVNYKLKMVNFL